MYFSPMAFSPSIQPWQLDMSKIQESAPMFENRSVASQEDQETMQEIMKRLLREMCMGNVEGAKSSRASLLNSMLENIA